MLRFPQISRVFAEPLARKLIVQSSDDAPYPIALCFEVCIGRHVRLRYIAGKRRSRQTLENGLRKVKPLSARRQAESETRRIDLPLVIPRPKVVALSRMAQRRVLGCSGHALTDGSPAQGTGCPDLTHHCTIHSMTSSFGSVMIVK
jgi:hypothetical protein